MSPAFKWKNWREQSGGSIFLNSKISGRATSIIRSVRFTETNKELDSLGLSWVRGAEPKFGKLSTSYLVAVRFANIFIKLKFVQFSS